MTEASQPQQEDLPTGELTDSDEEPQQEVELPDGPTE